MTEQLLAVLAVLGGLVGVLWLLRRRGIAQVRLPGKRGGAARQLEVLERLPLTPTHSLHLVRAGKTVLLVGVSPSSCQALSNVAVSAETQIAPEAAAAWGKV